ncbi:hypothetical protein DXC77_07480 [Lactobacillus gasseri]|jgi:hypothetical protein|nr:hypothetical protein DXC77_07480 [Lactobacillus gasseri]
MRKSKRKEQLEKTAPKEIRETDNVYLLIVVIVLLTFILCCLFQIPFDLVAFLLSLVVFFAIR